MLHRLLSFPGFYRVVIALMVLWPASMLRAQPYAPAATAVAASSTGPFVFVYDEAGRLVGVADAAGNTATYTYDAAGNVLSIVRGSSAVSILAFSPRSGPVGTNVTIVGAGFGATVAQNTVTFNGVSATVLTATQNQLVAVVPGGATTGPIRVTSPTGSAVSATSFTVGPNNAPSISGFTPTIGAPGSTVTITGTNFEPVAVNNRLAFNGNIGTVNSATATTIGTVVSATATSGPITISTPNGQATSTGDFFVPPSPYTAADVAVTGRMAIGETRDLTISQADKIGLVVFSGSAGQQISLGVGLGSGLDNSCHYMSIRRPDGFYLVDSTYVCGSSGFIDRQILPVSGTYLIAFDPTGTNTGTATLKLYNVPPDATAGIVPGGSPVTVTTTIPGQNLAVTFAGSAGQRISLGVSVEAASGGCGYLSILRPDGTALVDSTSICGTGFIDLQVLPVSGIYRVIFDLFGADTGSATLTLYNIPPDVPASIVPGGSPVTVTTTTPGQNAVWAFAGSAGQRISLTINNIALTGGSTCGYVHILRPDGTALTDSTSVCGTGFIDSQILPVSGTYRIIFDPFGTDTGSATLTLYNIPPDVPATIVPGGSPVTVTTTIPGQNAVWSFAGSAGQRISLTINAALTDGSTCGYVSILRPDGSALVDAAAQCASVFIDLQVLPVSGTYRIIFDPFRTDIGSVTLRLYNIPPDVPATIIPGGSPVTVTTTIPGQNAVWTFTGSAGQRISLTINIALTGDSTCGYVSILRPDGTALVDSIIKCGTDFIDLQVLPISSTYRITFDPPGADTGSATLTLYNIPPDVPAPIIPGGSPVTVTTTIPGQNAVLTFAGSTGQRISLTINIALTGGSTCGYVSILRPDGTALVASAFKCGMDFIDLQVLPVSGTYRITFDPFGADTGSATLTLHNVPPDPTAAIVPGGPPVTVRTTIPGQNAALTFAGSAGQRISFDISVTLAGGGCGYFSILQPDGSYFFSFGECGMGFFDLPDLPVSGTYRIVFDPIGTTTGTATLRLYTAPTVTSISPRSGTTLGGTRVAITGSNFQNGATVSIGDVPATGVSVVGNTITATTGAHATGTVSVSVTNPDNRSGTLSNSYFYDQPSGPLSFYSVPPCRLVDTRNPSGPLGGPSLDAGTQRVFTAIGSCGIPAGAKSLSVNVTVPAPAASGFLSLYPGNAIHMGTSSLNFSTGQTRANNAIVKLSTDGLGTLAVQNGASGNVDVIVDVTGYFM